MFFCTFSKQITRPSLQGPRNFYGTRWSESHGFLYRLPPFFLRLGYDDSNGIGDVHEYASTQQYYYYCKAPPFLYLNKEPGWPDTHARSTSSNVFQLAFFSFILSYFLLRTAGNVAETHITLTVLLRDEYHHDLLATYKQLRLGSPGKWITILLTFHGFALASWFSEYINASLLALL